MCVSCAALQIPACSITGSCGGNFIQYFTVMTVMISLAFGTARLWIFLYTQKSAPILNKEINFSKHD